MIADPGLYELVIGLLIVLVIGGCVGGLALWLSQRDYFMDRD